MQIHIDFNIDAKDGAAVRRNFNVYGDINGEGIELLAQLVKATAPVLREFEARSSHPFLADIKVEHEPAIQPQAQPESAPPAKRAKRGPKPALDAASLAPPVTAKPTEPFAGKLPAVEGFMTAAATALASPVTVESTQSIVDAPAQPEVEVVTVDEVLALIEHGLTSRKLSTMEVRRIMAEENLTALDKASPLALARLSIAIKGAFV